MKRISVSFPCVHGSGNGEMIKITCFPVQEMKGTIKIPALDIEDVARRIIGASRHDETDLRAATGVIAMFSNPQFSGMSYSLALAIADKMARHEHPEPGGKIYATGKISHDRQGEVESISSLKEKSRLVQLTAAPGDIYIFPRADYGHLDRDTSYILKQLQAIGVTCIPIRHISDLDNKLWQIIGKTNVLGETSNKKTLYDTVTRYIRPLSGLRYAVISALIVVAGIITMRSLNTETNDGIAVTSDNATSSDTPVLHERFATDTAHETIMPPAIDSESKQDEPEIGHLESGRIDLLTY